jgi:hypothetical protein
LGRYPTRTSGRHKQAAQRPRQAAQIKNWNDYSYCYMTDRVQPLAGLRIPAAGTDVVHRQMRPVPVAQIPQVDVGIPGIHRRIGLTHASVQYWFWWELKALHIGLLMASTAIVERPLDRARFLGFMPQSVVPVEVGEAPSVRQGGVLQPVRRIPATGRAAGGFR